MTGDHDVAEPSARPRRLVLVLVSLWSAWMVWWAVHRGARHDYVLYLGEWELVRHGIDPWSTDNNYGPLHNVLAYLVRFGRLGPKVVMVLAFLAVCFAFAARLIGSHRGSAGNVLVYVIAVPANFLVISVVASFGLNDTLAAALIGVAVLARFRRAFVVAGFMLAMATLLKYYPALLVPCFCIDGRRFEWRVAVSAGTTVIVGFASSLLVWGDGFVTAVRNGFNRPPKLLSVLSALQQHEIGRTWLVRSLIDHNGPVVLLASGVVFLACVGLRLSWIETSVVTMLTFLSVYKVGHPQFFIPLLVMILGLLVANTPDSRLLAYCCVPLLIGLSAFQFGYEILTPAYTGRWQWIRDEVGFAAFAVQAGTIGVYFSLRHRARPAERSPTPAISGTTTSADLESRHELAH